MHRDGGLVYLNPAALIVGSGQGGGRDNSQAEGDTFTGVILLLFYNPSGGCHARRDRHTHIPKRECESVVHSAYGVNKSKNEIRESLCESLNS